MLNDFEMICIDLPKKHKKINVYALGDVHVGSAEFNETAIKKKIQIILDDPDGVVCLCGDLGDFGLKNSKTNVYQQTMSPSTQIEYIYDLFKPLAEAGKIIAAVPGNHEERLVREVGICPLYDLCVRWGISDRYRENVAIVKISFGALNGGKARQVVTGIVTHGSTRNKHKKFISGFDGIDFAISGHTHTPEYSTHGKIRVDANKSTAKHVAYKEIVVDAHLKPGGYGLKKEYEIASTPELQYLECFIDRVNCGHFDKHLNFHSIQI